jgi:hypothetical protein
MLHMWHWSLEAPGVIFIGLDSKSDEVALTCGYKSGR